MGRREESRHLVELIGGNDRKGRGHQIGWNPHTSLCLRPEVEEPDGMMLAGLKNKRSKRQGLFGRHAVRLGEEGDESDLGGDRLWVGGREGEGGGADRGKGKISFTRDRG